MQKYYKNYIYSRTQLIHSQFVRKTEGTHSNKFLILLIETEKLTGKSKLLSMRISRSLHPQQRGRPLDSGYRKSAAFLMYTASRRPQALVRESCSSSIWMFSPKNHKAICIASKEIMQTFWSPCLAINQT